MFFYSSLGAVRLRHGWSSKQDERRKQVVAARRGALFWSGSVNLFRACSRRRAHRRGMGEQSGPCALHVASTPGRAHQSTATSFASRRISFFIIYLFISLPRRVAKLCFPTFGVTVLVFSKHY